MSETERDSDVGQIGAAVKAERTGRGWSLRKLAEAAGVSASLISAVENNRIVPTVSSLFALSDAFGLPAETFLPPRHRLPAPVVQDTVPPRKEGAGASEGGTPPDSGNLPVHRAESSTPVVAGAPAPNAPLIGAPPVAVTAPHEASPAEDRSIGPGTSSEARARGAARPSRIVRRRPLLHTGPARTPASPPVLADRDPIGRSPTGASPGEAVSASAGPSAVTAPATGGASEGSPLAGVTIVRHHDAPVMRLEGGSTWTRLSAVEAPDHTVIEVYLPPGQGSSAEMVTLSHGVEVVVLAGNVMVEASFGHRPIATGDIARVDRGVPHRFVAPSKKGDCRFLVIVLGRWDGRI